MATKKINSFWNEAFFRYLSLILTAVTAMAAAASSIAAWLTVQHAYAKSQVEESLLLDELRKLEVLEWQETFVYYTVDDMFEKRAFEKGITFGEIKSQYVIEVQGMANPVVPKAELSDLELRKVLLSLLGRQLLYQLPDGTYASHRAELKYGFGQSVKKEKAAMAAISMLTKKKERFSQEDLQSELCEHHAMTPIEAKMLIIELVAQRQWIRFDKDGKLYCVICQPSQDGEAPRAVPAPSQD